MSRKPCNKPGGPRAEVARYTYDSENRLSAEVQPPGCGELVCFYSMGGLTKRRGGQGLERVEDAGTSAAFITPWTRAPGTPRRERTFNVFVSSATGLVGRDWQRDYTVGGGTLAPAINPADTPFGPGWYKLGSVTVPASTAELTIHYHGRDSAAPCAVMVKQTFSNPGKLSGTDSDLT